MITVSARRGGRLAVVADAWHLEHDCEHTPPLFFLYYVFLFVFLCRNLGSLYSLIGAD
jgi:hypothetical protein